MPASSIAQTPSRSPQSLCRVSCRSRTGLPSGPRCAHVCVLVCVLVCMRERETDRERERQRDRDREEGKWTHNDARGYALHRKGKALTRGRADYGAGRQLRCTRPQGICDAGCRRDRGCAQGRSLVCGRAEGWQRRRYRILHGVPDRYASSHHRPQTLRLTLPTAFLGPRQSQGMPRL